MYRIFHLALATILAAATAHAETIRFGAILPLTGPAATTGMQQMRGIQFAIDHANAAGGVHGNAVEILFEDDRNTPAQSGLSFNKLANTSHVPLIFGAGRDPLLAMAPLAAGKKILLINAATRAASLETASSYLINMLPRTADEAAAIAGYLTAKGKTQGAILFQNDLDGTTGRDAFLKYYSEAGGSVLAQETIRSSQTDFRPALLKLADAAPQVVLVSITSGQRRLAQQFRQLGLTLTIAGTTSLADPTLIKDLASEGFLHTRLNLDPPAELAAEFKTKFGTDMDFSACQYYNAALVVLTVSGSILADGKALSGQTMHDTLFAIRKFHGLIPMEFDSNSATMPLELDVIHAGKDVAVAPTDGD